VFAVGGKIALDFFIPRRRSRPRLRGGYQLSDYEQEQELEMIGG
jgi:hypothetical protein